ncbi:hypothetical protein WJX81_007434 [Elliptochloris bilobata]|uniref:hydroxyacylglutathione hydrolase n=1 Tax=Elliptochloris bilobata TaxID=381761 RepID=A0AAW1S4R4_9CHLO
MRILPVPVLEDNYAYLLVDKHGSAAAVDPAEPQKVLDAARQEGLELSTVLTTHKHWDHAGGNEKMKQLCPGITVIGGINDHVQGATREVRDGERLSLGDIAVTCIETPGHTNGHICFLCREEGSTAAVFTGDTLFVGGCGRIFSGTPEQMYVSLNKKLATLPPETQAYCGHEYSVKNLEFAAYVDPDNPAVKEKLAWAKAQRAQGKPTIPSSIGAELATNPYLRCGEPALRASAGRAADARGAASVLGALRARKDRWGIDAALTSAVLAVARWVPSLARLLGAEKTFNPFLRCDRPALQKFAGAKDPVDVLAAVRRAKDNF